MVAVSNGVRQGGILSPLFCNVYTDGLSDILCRTETGVAIGSIMTSHFMQADDDLVILSSSAKGLQQLICIRADYGERHDIIFNRNYCTLNIQFISLNVQRLTFFQMYTYLDAY